MCRRTYVACTLLRDDDAASLHLEAGHLPGGRFRRGSSARSPEIYSSIAPAFEELESAGTVEPTTLIEFYRRHDEIDWWVSVEP